MKRILLHLAISVFAFGLGVAVSDVWRFAVNLPKPFLAHMPTRVSRLELVTIGFESNSATFLSNGGRITRSCQNFFSAEEANSVLQERRRNGSDVIESSDIVDRSGEHIGQTILILGSPTVIRLSTNRATLCETRASSMNEMRWFDKREFR